MVKAILTDIEGTTSSIRFVHEVLFPYAARTIPVFVRTHRERPEVAAILADVAREAGLATDDTEAQITQLLGWIAEDRKVTPLKTLQGLVWRDGFEQGIYQGHIYEDAAQQLRLWHQGGIKLYVFSSGSVAAQKLLFGYSEAGDLTGLFSGYFDTTTGPKQDAASYSHIARAIGQAAGDILFLSDVCAELDAACDSGMQTCWLQRPQDFDGQVLDSSHPVARDFYQIGTG